MLLHLQVYCKKEALSVPVVVKRLFNENIVFVNTIWKVLFTGLGLGMHKDFSIQFRFKRSRFDLIRFDNDSIINYFSYNAPRNWCIITFFHVYIKN